MLRFLSLIPEEEREDKTISFVNETVKFLPLLNIEGRQALSGPNARAVHLSPGYENYDIVCNQVTNDIQI